MTPDRRACASLPGRLSTSPGDEIDFAGSGYVAPRSVISQLPPPRLNISWQPNEVILWWERTKTPWNLESTSSLEAPVGWQIVQASFQMTNQRVEFRIPGGRLLTAQFFRLRQE
ncbi:MAG: hypothetical protein HYR88_05725 [Verrucomicrobia bacterium]|nr:hypothetical protein [Verrucomicrobiota bacterium]MBI3869005.1 hypothetical protein [Verrucomicrobiota bacterium]